MDYGILSLLPPVIAIGLAILTKQVSISLFLGIVTGELILNSWDVFASINGSLNEMVGIFNEAWITKTIICSFLVGGIITIISASGGVKGFNEFLTKKTKLVKNKKDSLLLAYFIGIIVFIESSITILLSGTDARPLTDEYKVSREKLAYAADSTSAPIFALIPLNGWVAMLMGIIVVQITSGVSNKKGLSIK
ncbi:MAG: hypothetical protein ACQEQH_03910 [Bacillota bacterium]